MKISRFKKILASGHHDTTLYHFTDHSNIPSILNHGILSKQLLETKKIAVPTYGGNKLSHNLDKQKGIYNFVSLCFTQNHPMCYVANVDGRIMMPIYLVISPDVLDLKGAKITLDIANKSDLEILDLEEGLDKIDHEVLYTRTDWHDPEIQKRRLAAERYELLIPKCVPVNLIKTKFF